VPELFRPENFPVFLRELPVDGKRFAIPSIDGGPIKVGVHRGGQIAMPDEIDRVVTKDDTTPVEEFVREYLPNLDPKVIRSEVCLYDNTPDFDYIIDRAPGAENIVVLGGSSGHGFQLAPVIGEIALDLALDGTTAYPISRFSWRRFASTSRMLVQRSAPQSAQPKLS
jgi:sarcosine oxidase